MDPLHIVWLDEFFRGASRIAWKLNPPLRESFRLGPHHGLVDEMVFRATFRDLAHLLQP